MFANSRDVAEFFGKEHKHVLRDIENIGPDLDQSRHESMFRQFHKNVLAGIHSILYTAEISAMDYFTPAQI